MGKGKLIGNVIAVIVMVVVMVAVGARLWANQQRLEVPMLWNATQGADGAVYIVLGNSMYREPVGQGGEPSALDLLELGIRDYNGDLLALPDGNFILSAGRIAAMDFDEKPRKTARAERHADDGSDYLMRCDLAARDCEILNGDDSATEVFRPSRAFGLSPGPGDTLLATDATGHEALLLAMDGRILDTLRDNFEFPNEIHLVNDDEAMVVDANNHRLASYSVDETGFGERTRERSILDWPGVEGWQKFPFAWARATDGSEWLLIAGDNMGDAILVRSHEGEERQIELPPGSDAVDFAVLEDRVLVLDQGTDRILAFSNAGKPLQDFGSAGLQAKLREHAEEREHFVSIMDASLAVLSLVLLLGVPLGLLYLKRRYKDERREHAESIKLKRDDAPVDSVASSDSAAMLDRLSGVYRFNRTLGFVDQGESWRLVTLLVLLLGAMVISQIFMASISMADFANGIAELLEKDPSQLALPLAGIFLPPFIMLYTRLEELRIDRQGVHYRSPLPFPLNRLQPSWTMRWEEIEDIRLSWFRSAKNPQFWRLTFVDEYGEERALVPMQWTQIGVKEPGIRLKELTRMTEGLIRRRIHERMLFRVLATQMQRLRRLRDQ